MKQQFYISLVFDKLLTDTAQKMKFSIMEFFSKCDRTRSFLRIWPHLLKKSLIENFIFCAGLWGIYQILGEKSR